MTGVCGINREALTRLRAEEDQRFRDRTKRSAALLERARASQPLGVPMSWFATMYQHTPPVVASGSGAWFEDVDSNRYLDMNLVDLAGTLGFANPVVTAAVKAAAERGVAFLLPTEDGIAATERLAEITGLPFWQFAGAASSANVELIRIARVATGRGKILKFDGTYHGHIDETLVMEVDNEVRSEGLGLPASATKDVKIVPFNDLAALERALAPGDVACVISEPVLTNSNLVFPDPGFWDEVRKLTRSAGTLLYLDEAHSYSFAFGGVTRKFSIDADGQVMGKGLGSGIPFAVYGLSGPRGAAERKHRPARKRAAQHCAGRHDLRQRHGAGGGARGSRGRADRAVLRGQRRLGQPPRRRTGGDLHATRPRMASAADRRPVGMDSIPRSAADREGSRAVAGFPLRRDETCFHGQPRHMGGDLLVRAGGFVHAPGGRRRHLPVGGGRIPRRH